MTPHEDSDPHDDLTGLPEEVAEDIRHAAAGAGTDSERYPPGSAGRLSHPWLRRATIVAGRLGDGVRGPRRSSPTGRTALPWPPPRPPGRTPCTPRSACGRPARPPPPGTTSSSAPHCASGCPRPAPPSPPLGWSPSSASGAREHQRARGVRGGARERKQQMARRVRPRRQVDAAFEPTGDRIEHRDCRAGERGQALRVVLVGAHERRSAVGEGETESVRADLTFGVGEPWCEMDVVECPQQGVVAADAVQHESVCVGQHQADRFVGERATQIVEHLSAAFGEQRSRCVDPGQRRFDLLQRHAVVLAAPPRREQPFGHLTSVGALQ